MNGTGDFLVEHRERPAYRRDLDRQIGTIQYQDVRVEHASVEYRNPAGLPFNQTMVQATPGSVGTARERAFHRSLELDLILVEKRADVEQQLVVVDACENGHRGLA